jgi:hypothetical protein
MGTCFFVLFFLLAGLFTVATAVRWFEQTAEAVDQRWWNKLVLLVLMPFAVWLFPSRVSAGRPTEVPHHEPVRGFGGLPKGGINERATATMDEQQTPRPVIPLASSSDGPPPGTPKEFLGMPKIPRKRPSAKASVDPEKLAKLKQKMKEQGMLEDDGDASA